MRALWSPARYQYPGYLLTGEQLRLFGRHFGKRHMEVLARMTQHVLKQELHRAGGLVHRAVRQLLLLHHVQQVGLYFLLRIRGRVSAVVFGHAPDGTNIDRLGARRKAALNHRVRSSMR